MLWVLNIPKFSIWQNSVHVRVLNMQGSHNAQCSEYARICLDRALNISWVLLMPNFWIWKGSESTRVISKICHNMTEYVWIGHEPGWNVWFYDNRQGSGYVSCNA